MPRRGIIQVNDGMEIIFFILIYAEMIETHVGTHLKDAIKAHYMFLGWHPHLFDGSFSAFSFSVFVLSPPQLVQSVLHFNMLKETQRLR